MVKNPPASAGGPRDMGLISQTPGRREDPLEEEMATHSNTLYLCISLKKKKKTMKTTYCVSCKSGTVLNVFKICF